eukprot:6149463-Amphidinium_carterae.2
MEKVFTYQRWHLQVKSTSEVEVALFSGGAFVDSWDYKETRESRLAILLCVVGETALVVVAAHLNQLDQAATLTFAGRVLAENDILAACGVEDIMLYVLPRDNYMEMHGTTFHSSAPIFSWGSTAPADEALRPSKLVGLTSGG